MPAESETSLPAILRTLTAHRVEFIVVGGVSAALQGAPVTTFDIDVVHSRAPENWMPITARSRSEDSSRRNRTWKPVVTSC